MHQLLKKWIIPVLSMLLVFALAAAGAAENNEVEDWISQGQEALEKDDYESSLRYFSLAAEAGNPFAQYMTAGHYFYGLGTEQDYEKALEYFKLSADLGNADGQECLGYLYLEGLGVEQSREKAVELYKLAAEGGSEEAQQQLILLGE